jgi:hypothetical protein
VKEDGLIAFKNLKEILDITVRWEKSLKDFYDVAEFALRNKKSKEVIDLLRSNLVVRLEILQNINLDDYGKTGWVRYAPDYKDESLIPIKTISRDANPQEIFTRILEYVKKLKSFYQTISSKLVAAKQKELFDSLVQFKEDQIYEINRFMESYAPEEKGGGSE